MLDLNSLDSREDFKVTLLQKAIRDAGFRRTLTSNPSSVLEQEVGSELASRLTLSAHQERNDRFFIVVNFNPKAPGELREMTPTKDEGVEAFLVRKAWKDPGYKAQLLADPVGKIRDEFGMELKGGAAVSAFAETSTSFHIVLPKALLSQEEAQVRAQNELSDEQLETVSGGYCSVITWIREKLSVPPSNTQSQCCQYASGVRG